MATQTVQEYESHTTTSESWRGSGAPTAGEGASSAAVLKKMKGFRIEFGPSRKDILHFTSQLAVMVRAGISLQDTLESIAEQSDNDKFRRVLRDL